MCVNSVAVAIDGPAGAGKSTICEAAAAALGFVHVDTGALYRTIGLAVCRRGIAGDDAQAVADALPDIHIALDYQDGVQRVLLIGEEVSEAIRTPEMSLYASQVSAIPAVRDFLLGFQRDLARRQSVIMDGRDIGTVILPDAPVKIFLTASPEARAARRYAQQRMQGETESEESVLEKILARDRQDETRAVAPLRQAEDAVRVDTSEMTLEESIAAVLEVIDRKMKR